MTIISTSSIFAKEHFDNAYQEIVQLNKQKDSYRIVLMRFLNSYGLNSKEKDENIAKAFFIGIVFDIFGYEAANKREKTLLTIGLLDGFPREIKAEERRAKYAEATGWNAKPKTLTGECINPLKELARKFGDNLSIAVLENIDERRDNIEKVLSDLDFADAIIDYYVQLCSERKYCQKDENGKLEILFPSCRHTEKKSTESNADENEKMIKMKTRIVGEKKWQNSLDVKLTDCIEHQLSLHNITGRTVEDVVARISLPTNMEYVPGSTILYNTTNPDGVAMKDGICDAGVNIGGYSPNGDAYVRIQTKVIDKNLMHGGNNRLITWGKISIVKTTNSTQHTFVEQDCTDLYCSL